MDHINSKTTRLYVAAIDFGTTYSGYAFSPKHEWTKVHTNYFIGAGKLISHKAPTALLLNPDKSFQAFGYEAEDQYCDLAADEEHGDYYYFLRFKMLLHDENIKLNRDTCCKEEGGKEMEAIEVFALCIRYLKDHLIETIQKSINGITQHDIDFVLTVPAIWNDRAKQFMREAALKGGIDGHQLRIALEPEAASIYAQHLHLESQELSNTLRLGVLESGTKYMVCDLGGGTADITVHEKMSDGTLAEIRPASGGPWGGKSVDEAFMEFLKDLFSEEIMTKFKDECMEDYLELWRTFEVRKRSLEPEKEGNIHFSIPLALINMVKKDKEKKSVENLIKCSKYAKTLSFNQGKLKFSNENFTRFFESTVQNIKVHIQEILQDAEVQDVKTIVMVGGFSECALVQKAMKDAFQQKKVIIPEKSGLAVLMGAVYFGHVPGAVSRRVARYTYGIQSWPEFNPAKHDTNKKTSLDNSIRCKDVFFKFVSKGEIITPGLQKAQIFKALSPSQQYLRCAVFISDSVDPQYTDEPGCRKIGDLSIDLADLRLGIDAAEFEESMYFGETELKVSARNLYTNRREEVKFDLLANMD